MEAEHDFACAETQRPTSPSACRQLSPQPVDLLHSRESFHSLCSEDEASDLNQYKTAAILVLCVTSCSEHDCAAYTHFNPLQGGTHSSRCALTNRYKQHTSHQDYLLWSAKIHSVVILKVTF